MALFALLMPDRLVAVLLEQVEAMATDPLSVNSPGERVEELEHEIEALQRQAVRLATCDAFRRLYGGPWCAFDHICSAGNVSVEGGSRGAQADQDLARKIGKEVEGSLRSLIATEIRTQTRPVASWRASAVVHNHS